MFPTPLDIFQGAHRSAICTRLSAFLMYTTVWRNCAGNKQKPYKITRINMFAPYDKAKLDIEIIRGLNLAVVNLTTVQVTKLPL
jgi:hypothetical protein